MVLGMIASLTGILVSTLAASGPLPDIKQILDTEQLNEPDLPAEGATEEDVEGQESIEEEGAEEEGIEDSESTQETERTIRPYDPLRPVVTCPSDIETLTALLIRDIPTYANRVLHRSAAVLPSYEEKDEAEVGNLLIREPYRPAFIIVAGRPELEPLNLDEYALTTNSTAGGPLTQLFFTTLSRQYSNSQLSQVQSFNEVQSYHWLFLAESDNGWWLAFMYSRTDDPDTPRAPTAPSESSSGSVGQAVQLWLRDCRAGAIEPLVTELSVTEPVETEPVETEPLD